VVSLEEDLRTIDELVAQRGADRALHGEQQAADSAGERALLAMQMEKAQAVLASLVGRKEQILEPLRGQAAQAAAKAYREKAAKDPTVYLDEELEARLTQQFFANLTKSIRVDPQFTKLLQDIEAAKSAVKQAAEQIAALGVKDNQSALAHKASYKAFVEAQTDRRRVNEAALLDLRGELCRAEMRSQTALMYCAECGAPLGAVAAPAVLDEWMKRFEAAASEHLEHLELLTSNAETLALCLEQLQRDAVGRQAALLAAIQSLSTSLERAIVSSNGQLAKALSGSFAAIQQSMNALVARANAAQQRERVEDLKKFFDQ
jgi:hypothetical protein